MLRYIHPSPPEMEKPTCFQPTFFEILSPPPFPILGFGSLYRHPSSCPPRQSIAMDGSVSKSVADGGGGRERGMSVEELIDGYQSLRASNAALEHMVEVEKMEIR
jgi:hypothetical protein